MSSNPHEITDDELEPLLNDDGSIDTTEVRSRNQYRPDDTDTSEPLTVAECEVLRAEMVGRPSTNESAEKRGVRETTVAFHARGGCAHDDEVAHPPLTYVRSCAPSERHWEVAGDE